MAIKRRRYVGRVEVTKSRDKIQKKLDNGFSYAMIYDELVNNNLLSISYRQFCKCLTQYFDVEKRKYKNSKNIDLEKKSISKPKEKSFGQRTKDKKSIVGENSPHSSSNI